MTLDDTHVARLLDEATADLTPRTIQVDTTRHSRSPVVAVVVGTLLVTATGAGVAVISQRDSAPLMSATQTATASATTLSQGQLVMAAQAVVLAAGQGTVPRVATAMTNAAGTGLVINIEKDASGDLNGIRVALEQIANLPVEVAIATTAPVRPGANELASQSLDVGVTGPLSIGVHCGLTYARIDGRFWETPQIGNGSSPPGSGIDELLTGAVTRTRIDEAQFISPSLTAPVTFRPLTATEQPTLCF